MKTLLIILFFCCTLSVQAQKLTKAEKKAAKELEAKQQTITDKKNHHIALSAIENNQWAFQTNGLYDQNGRRLNVPTTQPNFAGFDGVNFYALIIEADPKGEFIRPYQVDSQGKFISKKTDKKGNIVFKFLSHAPTRSESTLILNKDSDFATLHINFDRGGATYNGKVMPLTECWYFMTYERKPKKK